jgi:predicted glutamine amidotransferase
MCGIVGCMGQLSQQDEKVLQQLLIVDSLRGDHSTGIAVVPRVGDVQVAKQLGDPFQLFETRQYEQALKGINRAIIGHNRYATQGAVNRKNAHPFEFDTLVGVHNGTLTNKFRLDDSIQYQVDSENLYHHINKKGLKDALSLINGAWALVWWDKINETMNFLRNKERTLYFTAVKDNRAIYWASEAWMLKSILTRNNIEHSEPVMFAEDKHYAFSIDSTGKLEKARVANATSTYVAPVFHVANRHPYGTYFPKSGTLPAANSSKDEVKKEGVAPVTAQSVNSKSGYSGTKNARLEILDMGVDANGGTYFTCFDDSMPSTNIRLYYNKKDAPDPKQLLGTEIIADIGMLQADGLYYKVLHSSVKWEDTPFETDDEEAVVHVGHDGEMYSLEDWMHKYGECVWCGGNVHPEESHQLTTEGHAVCKDCIHEDEVKQFVKIARSQIVH